MNLIKKHGGILAAFSALCVLCVLGGILFSSFSKPVFGLIDMEGNRDALKGVTVEGIVQDGWLSNRFAINDGVLSERFLPYGEPFNFNTSRYGSGSLHNPLDEKNFYEPVAEYEPGGVERVEYRFETDAQNETELVRVNVERLIYAKSAKIFAAIDRRIYGNIKRNSWPFTKLSVFSGVELNLLELSRTAGREIVLVQKGAQYLSKEEAAGYTVNPETVDWQSGFSLTFADTGEPVEALRPERGELIAVQNGKVFFIPAFGPGWSGETAIFAALSFADNYSSPASFQIDPMGEAKELTTLPLTGEKAWGLYPAGTEHLLLITMRGDIPIFRLYDAASGALTDQRELPPDKDNRFETIWFYPQADGFSIAHTGAPGGEVSLIGTLIKDGRMDIRFAIPDSGCGEPLGMAIVAEQLVAVGGETTKSPETDENGASPPRAYLLSIFGGEGLKYRGRFTDPCREDFLSGLRISAGVPQRYWQEVVIKSSRE